MAVLGQASWADPGARRRRRGLRGRHSWPPDPRRLDPLYGLVRRFRWLWEQQMTVRIRLMILMARPAVVLLLGLFTALGLAQAGQAENRVLLVKALLVVVGFLLFSVAVNDLAD